MERKPAPSFKSLSEVPVAILAGGLGTRLKQSLPDRPKVLAPVNGQPFLELLLTWLERQGARKVVLLLGHLADQVEGYLHSRPASALQIEVRVEPEPLGTGGAIALSYDLLAPCAVIINGDTFLDLDLRGFVETESSTPSPASIVVTHQKDTGRYGRCEIENDRLLSFSEKLPGSSGWVNAGVYLLKQPALKAIAMNSRSSIEKDYFEKLPSGSIRVWKAEGVFIDIGTPESLMAAKSIITDYAATESPINSRSDK